MGCLVALVAVALPRLADLVLWRARPERFRAAFGGSRVWPVLGIACFPLTTLLYVFRWAPAGGLRGVDWLWLILAVALDSNAAGSAHTNRDKVPRYGTAGAVPPRPNAITPGVP